MSMGEVQEINNEIIKDLQEENDWLRVNYNILRSLVKDKFFEFKDPYFALIKAKNKKEAIKIYMEFIAEDEKNSLKEEIQQVSRDYALLKFSESATDFKDFSTLESIIKTFNSDEVDLLLVDGALL